MKNLTKQLKIKSKKLSNPIMDELIEQFEMSKSQRFFSRLVNNFEMENNKYKLNIR